MAGDSLGVSPLTLAEILVGPARGGLVDVVLKALEELAIGDVPLPRDGAVRLAELRCATGLKLPDCCVLLAAEAQGGAGVASFDDHLVALAADRGLTVYP